MTDLSYLFVPGSRPDRYEKALASGADVVIVDLEDAVALEDKASARRSVTAALEKSISKPVFIRINAIDTSWFREDLDALAGLTASGRKQLKGVLVPKVEDELAIASVIHELPGVQVIALIESAAGLSVLREIAKVPGLTRLALGAADLSFDLDVELQSTTIDWVYGHLVLESRLAGLPGPVASPPFHIGDHDAILAEAQRLRGMGNTGQLGIHPGQVAAINAGFAPNQKQVSWAHRVLSAEGDGAVQVDGQMIDKPIRERAERILQNARQPAAEN